MVYWIRQDNYHNWPVRMVRAPYRLWGRCLCLQFNLFLSSSMLHAALGTGRSIYTEMWVTWMPSPVDMDAHYQGRHELPVTEARFLWGKDNLTCNLFWFICVFDLVELWKLRMFFINSNGPSRTFAVQCLTLQLRIQGLREVKWVPQAQPISREPGQGFRASQPVLITWPTAAALSPFSSPVSSCL